MSATTVEVTEASRALLIELVKDADNWSGIDGSVLVDISKEQRGNLSQLKKAGLVSTHMDEDGNTWLTFTDAGKKLAAEIGGAAPRTA